MYEMCSIGCKKPLLVLKENMRREGTVKIEPLFLQLFESPQFLFIFYSKHWKI